jgi:ceramide glucosyltransferase
MPLPLALGLWLVQPEWWWLAAATLAMRAAAAWATAGLVLRDGLTARLFWLVPVQDVLSLVMWVGGFFGNTILWRGRKYYLRADGRFELVG